VKRTVSILVGVATLGVGVYLGSCLWAQQPASSSARPAAAPLQTRIALVNLGEVIKNYQKFKMYQEQLKNDSLPLQKELEQKRALAVAKDAEAKKPETPADKREQLLKEIKVMEREMQDKVDEANNTFGKRRMDQLVTIYKDVQAAVGAYARSYAIELVLQYSEGNETEKFSPTNLQQKLGNQACMPIYNDPRMDITQSVITMLNQHMATTTPTSGTVPAGHAAPAAPR
jgi:Skp family chaperone for outer membrane proteins